MDKTLLTLALLEEKELFSVSVEDKYTGWEIEMHW